MALEMTLRSHLWCLSRRLQGVACSTVSYVVVMAIRQVIESDLSGKPGADTVSFSVNGSWYEVDLTETERDEMQNLIEKYVEHGRKVAAPTIVNRETPETTVKERQRIREWAKGKGLPVADRGVIPKEIYEAYKKSPDAKR